MTDIEKINTKNQTQVVTFMHELIDRERERLQDIQAALRNGDLVKAVDEFWELEEHVGNMAARMRNAGIQEPKREGERE